MGDSANAHLAYGYHLGGNEEGWNLAGADEYKQIDFDWSDGGYSFAEDCVEKLIAAAGFTEPDPGGDGRSDWYSRRRQVELALPVEVVRSGHHEYPGWVLIAVGSEESVEWSDAMELDLDGLAAMPAANGWDAKLAAAIAALGITPTQDGPRWLVFPSYG